MRSFVRYLTSDDQELVKSFLKRTTTEMTATTDETIEILNRSDETLVGVFDEKSQLVGTCFVTNTNNSFGKYKINDVFVLPKCRNKGYGTELISETVKMLRGNSVYACVPEEHEMLFSLVGFEPVNAEIMAINI